MRSIPAPIGMTRPNEAYRRVAEWECATTGHDVCMTWTANVAYPTGLVCERCGDTFRVVPDVVEILMLSDCRV